MYLVLYTDMDIEHQEQAYMKYLIDDLEEYAQSVSKSVYHRYYGD